MKNFKNYQESHPCVSTTLLIYEVFTDYSFAVINMGVLMTVNSEVMATLCYVCPVYLFMPVKKKV